MFTTQPLLINSLVGVVRLERNSAGVTIMAYRFLEQFSKCTWLVEEERTSLRYVMKKVECFDELDANELFSKMKPYQNIRHPFLVPCHHLFVSWDEDRAVYLCIVSDYIPRGSLGLLLATQRESGQWLEKTQLKSWIGQLIEALVFAHRQHSYHKKLKSTNVFLSDNNSLAIGDFTPSVACSGPPGSQNWCSPESVDAVNDSQYDERSDVWSLGCIFLEMSTTGCLNDNDFVSVLYQLKVDPQILDNLLKKVVSQYGEDIGSLIQSMLRQSYHQRPLLFELCDRPIVRDCFSLYNSPLLKELTTFTDEQDVIAMKLRKSKFSLEAQAALIDDLILLLQNTDGALLKTSLQDLIISSLTRYKTSPNIAAKSLYVLYLGSASLGNCHDIISLTAAAMEIHQHDLSVIMPSLQLLVALSFKDSAVSNMINCNLINAALRIVKAFGEGSPDIIRTACILLTNIINTQRGALVAAVQGEMIQGVLMSLQRHVDSAAMVSAVLSLLWVSTSSGDAVMEMCTPSTVSLMCRILHCHKQVSMIAKLGVALLAILSKIKEEVLYSMADLRSNPNGLDVVIEIISCQSDNVDVMEQTLCLLRELTKNDDIKAEMIHRNLREVFSCYLNRACLSKELKQDAQSLMTQLVE